MRLVQTHEALKHIEGHRQAGSIVSIGRVQGHRFPGQVVDDILLGREAVKPVRLGRSTGPPRADSAVRAVRRCLHG